MNKIKLGAFIIISIFITACGSAGVSTGTNTEPSTEPSTEQSTGPSTEIKIAEDMALPFEVKTAFADMRPDRTQVHFVIGNYDFTVKPKSANSVEKIDTDGHVRVTIGLRGEKNDDFNNPVQPGEYTGKQIGWVDVFHYANGSQQIVNLRDVDGKVTISEVTDAEITGSIDVTKDGKAVKANFTAKKIK